MAETWIERAAARTWSPIKAYPDRREDYFDVPMLVTCGVCLGVCGSHRFGCLRCIEEVAARMLASEPLLVSLGITETPEEQCRKLVESYTGEAAAHWRAVGERLVTIRART